MTNWRILTTVGFLALAGIHPGTAQETKKPATPPEQAALTAALKIKDPAKRLEALAVFLGEYPDKFTSRARGSSVTTAVALYAKDKPALLAEFRKQLAATPKTIDQIDLHRTLATELTGKGLFLDEAIKAANRAVALDSLEVFGAALKATAKANKRPDPTGETIRARHQLYRVGLLEAQGQALLKAGKHRAAANSLKAALQLDSSNGAAALGLASIAEKRKRAKEALHYATIAMLGRATPEATKKIEGLYAKAHGGSLDGLEQYLDESYAKLFPAPVHPAKYKPSPKRASFPERKVRTVLAEVHTGSGCPPCAAADLAFDSLMERYNRDELVVLMYHQHIPRPDPMTNAETRERWEFVAGNGAPTYLVDGKMSGGGGPRSDTKSITERIETLIAPALERESGAALQLDAAGDRVNVRVRVAVSELEAMPAGTKLQLRIALVERMVKYSGENGIRYHANVVRSLVSLPVKEAGAMVSTFNLEQVQAKLERHIRDFETKDEDHNPDGTFRFMAYVHTINPANLGVVVYLENEETKDVLQSRWAEVKAESNVRISSNVP